MPRLPFPHRPGDPASSQLDELLRGGSISGARSASNGAASGGEWDDVSKVLRAAAAPGAPTELAAETAMLAAFRRAHLGAPSRRRSLVRPRMLTTLLTGKLAAVLTAAAVGATGAATAAYANVLPDSAQNIAHHIIAAPPAHSHASTTAREHGHQFSPSPTATATASESASASASETATESASATATADETATATATATASPSVPSQLNAAFGLCTAWSNAVRHGLQDQVGFRDKLAGLAGGAANVATFCATVQHQSDDASQSQSPESTTTADTTEHHGNSGGQGHGNANGHGHGADDGATPSPTPSPTS